tara:strand:- start:118 stop:294 length:177 start_codon:yes stop_codon:yes gene_type:complete
MKTFKVEFDEITTHIGTIKANSIKDAKKIVTSNRVENVEPVIGETKIQFIEEIKNDNS